MRKTLILVFFAILLGVNTKAQRFEEYLCFNHEKEDVFRFFQRGVKVIDEEGKELRRSEPVFCNIFFSEGFDRVAVSVPIISLEHDEKEGFERGRVWLCLDYDLRPVFIFPSNTYHVTKIVDGMFLYEDKPGHYSTVGLVDRDGKVIFEAPYEMIYLEKDLCIGVKNITEGNDYSGFQTWVAEFRKRASDALLVIKLKTPKDESVGLWFEVKDEEDTEWFEQRLKEDAFHRGLNHVVHSRMKEAAECFKECLNSKNPEIVSCAKYNIEALSWYIW